MNMRLGFTTDVVEEARGDVASERVAAEAEKACRSKKDAPATANNTEFFRLSKFDLMIGS
jgi:hypothetical protein